jgi:hypothetical protein
VVTGAYRAVVYIKEHMKLDATTASEKDSKEVVRICTVYAQKGMWNIFIVIFCFALALPFFNPYFFIGYLIAIAFFGLFQAIFMANAGGAWDNAKKIVEVDLRQKGTELHAATVVGDTVGDPFKDTSSVALNPVIKFTTLFGLLAVEIAVTMQIRDVVLEYLEECHRLGIWRIRIVHGKGIGQLREIVHNTLRGHPAVQEFRLAGSAQGGWGATVVDLQRSAGSGSDKQDPAR